MGEGSKTLSNFVHPHVNQEVLDKRGPTRYDKKSNNIAPNNVELFHPALFQDLTSD